MKTEYLHKTRDGRLIPLGELSDEHLYNIIRFIERKAEEGINIQTGSFMIDEVFDYDIDTIYGKDVKELMNYKHYKKERKRRANLAKSSLHWNALNPLFDEEWKSPKALLTATIEWMPIDMGYAGTIKLYDTTIWYKFVKESKRNQLKAEIERKILSIYADFGKDIEGVAK